MEVRDGPIGRIVRGAAIVGLVAVVALRALPADESPLVAAPLLNRIASSARDLAGRGRRTEAGVLVEVEAALRAPAADLAALREAVTKALAKSKPAPLPLPEPGRTLQRLAAELAATLPSFTTDEQRRIVAREILRLDGANRPAHEALAHVERRGAFVPAGLVPALDRRGEIETTIQAARRIDVDLQNEESWMAILETVYGRKGVAVRYGDVSVHSVKHSPEKLARELRQALRALALTNWCLNGELTVPPSRKLVMVCVDSADAYKRAVDAARKMGDVSAEESARALTMGAFYTSGYLVVNATFETQIASNAYFDLALSCYVEGKRFGNAQPTLVAGHMNWVYSGFLGIPMPNVAWTESEEAKKGVTSDSPQDAAERKEMQRLAKAGLHGSRMWIKWLVRRSEDPAWARSMVDQVGKIQGNDLMKSTLVVEYLQETNEFGSVLRDTYGENPGAEAFEKGLGKPLPAFEECWREWLFAGDPPSGLAQTLGALPVEPMSTPERAVIDYLNGLRKKTLGKDAAAVGIDRELSDGCRAHALYLGKNPQQIVAWPDAHEEFPTAEGFSAAGCRAGLSSVIVGPGIDDPADAVDGWMATFYHRLPLIEPGLVRIGWALEKGVAVLDAGSLCAPPENVCEVLWPPAGSNNMPRRFPGELPNPVPGESQAQWGYPVTLQFFNYSVDPDVQMKLHVGGTRAGPEVPCWYSTPQKPTNTDLAPAGAFCLIPKTPLAAATLYTVAVDGWPAGARGSDWQFTTGAK